MLFSLATTKAGTNPCSPTFYQLSDFGIERTYTLDNGTFDGIVDPSCGDYQGQDFWVEFTGPSSGLINIELLDGSITDAAFEVYWNACNGLASSIGCHSDRNCGSIPMPGANLEVIPGQTYHVRIFQEGGGGGTLGFRMSDIGGSEFTTQGDAEPYDSGNPAETCFKLTDASTNEVGCAWFDTPINFDAGFEINYSLFFGDSDAGAEGIAFIFHRDNNPDCDNNGDGVGMFDLQGGAFVVEFDTYNDGGGLFGSDIPEDHVAIRLDNGPFGLTLAGPVSLGNIEDNTFHDVTLLWDPNTNQFQIFFDGNVVISTNINTIINLFGIGNDVFWGVTGTTDSGNEVNEQIFCFDGFRIENTGSVETRIDETICADGVFVFGGVPIFEPGEYVDVFPAANGCDSTVTLNLQQAIIDLMGETEISLGCGDDNIRETLDVTLDSNIDPNRLSIEWATDNGSFESGENTLTPIINAAGTYTLTVESDELDCESEFVVSVTEAELPFFSVEGGVIGCPGSDDSTIVITCNFDGDYDVFWSTTNGNSLGPTNTPSLEVDTAGNYTVTVTDPISGCSNSAEVSVSSAGGIVEESLQSMFFCPGESGPIFLDAELEGEVISFEWTPAEGLSDPLALNPEVLDLSEEQEFTLSYKTPIGQNLVQNGSFAFGDISFASDYVSGAGSTGQYLITDSPTDFSAGFLDCNDNSSTDSQMMVVDGHTQGGQNVWCQEVEIEEGTSYYFTAWATNVCSSCTSPFPILALTINGQEVNTPFLLDTPACEWTQISHDPFTNQAQCWVGQGTVAELCITNLETSSNGNDFAIDDIGFYLVCGSGIGECGVFPEPENDIVIDPAEIACQPDGIVNLNATPQGQNTTNVSWSWQAAGADASIVNGGDTGTPMVQGEGEYIVTLIDNITGCETMESITLEMGDIAFPIYSLFGEDIDCLNPTAFIGVNGLDESNYSFDWTSNGTSVGGSTSDISVESPGQYEVVITSLTNGCTETGFVSVFGDFDLPELSITPVSALNCNQVDQSITLEVNTSSSSILYEWTTQDGLILSGENSMSPEIMGAGTYTVLFVDLDNGCENSEDIVITENLASPIVSASSTVSNNILDCNNPQAEIIVDGTGLEYQWSSDPNIISALDGNSISVIDAGSYDVLVTDPNTGCDTSITVVVNADFAEPTVVAGLPQTITCAEQSINLPGFSSDNIVEIEWQTAGGFIISGGDTFTPEISGAGVYTVIVTGENGCTADDSVTISADEDSPFIAQIPTLSIDCNNPSVVIDATNSSSGPEFDFTWSDLDGNIISEFTTLNPTVTEAGQYQLTIINTNNGCDVQTIVTVENISVDPAGIPTSVSSLNCTDLSSIFGLETTNASWSYTWSDMNGVLTDEDGFQIEATVEGQYNLIVTDLNNGCTSEYSFTLESEMNTPSLEFNGNTSLSCDLSELQISVITDAFNPSYSWQTGDGNIVETTDASSILLDMAGTYAVTITDGLTSCTVEDEITIVADENVPIVMIPSVANLTCDIEEVLLISNVDNIGGEVEFLWSTDDGILASPNGAANITAGAPGTYVLTVLNTANGCQASNFILVEESFNTFLIEIDEPDDLNCDLTQIVLNAEDVGALEVEYLWTTSDGSILSGEDGLTPTVSQAGEYILTVTDLETGCTSSSSIIVVQDGELPNIDIVPVDMLNCETTQLTVDASGSSQGLDILTVWSTIDGNIVSGENTLTPVVDRAGEYILTITDVSNNCVATELVTLESNQIAPEIDFAPLNAINCDLASVEINTTIASANTNLAFVWTTTDGNIVGSSNTANIEVDAEGMYTLMVTDLDNMCSESFTVEIEANNEVPDVSLDIPDDLDCTNMTSILSVDFPTNNPNLIFEWNTVDGTIDGDAFNPEIIVSAEGNYTVLVTDTESNCETLLSTFVNSNIETPQLDFIIPDMITCVNMQSVINTQTDLNGLIYAWSTVDGLITSADNGEDIVVESAGTYSLIVTDPTNSCTNMIEVVVLEDIDLPTVEIEPALELTCAIEEQNLSGNGSSMGSEFTYTWSTSMGAIISGDNTLNPLIAAPGYYVLQITNNDNSCVQTDSILVTENAVQPLANIMQPATIDCINEVVSLSTDIPAGTDFVFEWSTLNGNILSDANLNTIEVDQAGVYELSLLDNLNGCDNTLTVEVFSNKEQPTLELAPGFTLTCDQEDGVLSILDIDPDAVLNWFDPQGNMIASTNTVTINIPGTYTAVATSLLNGCETIREVEVLSNDNMPTELLANIIAPACAEDTVSIELLEVIGGEGPYLYSTDGGQTFGDVLVLEDILPGTTITIIVMDVNGCELPVEFIIPNVVPVFVNLPSQIDLSLGESVQLQVETNIEEIDIDQIIWTPNIGLSCVDCLNPTATPIADIRYQVEIINLNGCSDFASILLRVDSDQSVYIPNAFSPFNADGFNDRFNLFAKPGIITQVLSLQVYDRWGNQVFQNENFNPIEEASGWDGRFRSEKAQVGVYVYYAVVEYPDGSTELFQGDVTLMD